MVRYTDITDIQIQRKVSGSATTGFSVVFTIAGRSDYLDVTIEDWRNFGTNTEQFVQEINSHKFSMMQQTQQ